MEKRGVQYVDMQAMNSAVTEFTPEEQATLRMINDRVAAGKNLEDVLNFLFEETQDLMPCDRIGVSFLEEDGRRLVAHWARAKYEPLVLGKGYTGEMEGSSLQRVMDEGTPRIINDLEEYLEAHPGSTSTKVLVREGVRSSLTCPLMVDGRPIGFAFRSSRKKGAYSQHEVALHQAIHVRLSQAVEKAWRIQQLEDANRAYMEMLGFVSHELKSPVAAIITQSKMLQEGLWGDLQPKQHEIVGKLVTRAEYLLNLTREYLDLARFEGGQAQPRLTEGLDFWNDLFLPSLEVVQPQYNESGIDLELPTDPGPLPLDADATMLKVVLVNLLGNAAKYGTPKGKVKVNLAVSEERIRFSVWNEGPGFPESMKGYLFRRFSRLPKKELITRKGSGVGLYVTWQIMQMHKGRIWADSKEGEWAEFFIDLPRHAAPAPQPQ